MLIHNDAAFDVSQKEKLVTGEGVECIGVTNHLGPVLLAGFLMESLSNRQQGRVITISSKGLMAYPFLKVDLDDPSR